MGVKEDVWLIFHWGSVSVTTNGVEEETISHLPCRVDSGSGIHRDPL